MIIWPRANTFIASVRLLAWMYFYLVDVHIVPALDVCNIKLTTVVCSFGKVGSYYSH